MMKRQNKKMVISPHLNSMNTCWFNDIQFLILSSVDWDYLQQRMHVFARGLASYGAQVFFVENTGVGKRLKASVKDLTLVRNRIKKLFPLKKIGNLKSTPNNLKVITPLVLPPATRIETLLNHYFFIPQLIKKLKKEGLSKKIILITCLPTTISIEIIKKITPRLVIYDCASNLEGDPNVPDNFREIENRLLKLADVVLTDSIFLYNKFKAIHSNVFRIHHGVNTILFGSISHIKGDRKLTCYFGTIGTWIDWNIIKALVSSGYKVRIIGKNLLPSNINLPDGVSIEGPYDQIKLVQRIKDCGTIILPYITDTSHMKGVIPAKIYECLQTGKPILSSLLENYDAEIKACIYICTSPQEFCDTLNNLDKLENDRIKEMRKECAKKQSHEDNLKKLIEIIESALINKKKG